MLYLVPKFSAPYPYQGKQVPLISVWCNYDVIDVNRKIIGTSDFYWNCGRSVLKLKKKIAKGNNFICISITWVTPTPCMPIFDSPRGWWVSSSPTVSGMMDEKRRGRQPKQCFHNIRERSGMSYTQAKCIAQKKKHGETGYATRPNDVQMWSPIVRCDGGSKARQGIISGTKWESNSLKKAF